MAGVQDALDGLKARLETVRGLRVIDYNPSSWSDFPLATVGLAWRSGSQVGLGGASFEGEMLVTVIAPMRTTHPTCRDLMPFIDPLGAMSVEAAIDSDSTLGGSVDDARLVEVGEIGPRRMGGCTYAGADFRIRFVKQITGG